LTYPTAPESPVKVRELHRKWRNRLLATVFFQI